jgi:hypothetical protein
MVQGEMPAMRQHRPLNARVLCAHRLFVRHIILLSAIRPMNRQQTHTQRLFHSVPWPVLYRLCGTFGSSFSSSRFVGFSTTFCVDSILFCQNFAILPKQVLGGFPERLANDHLKNVS